MKGELLQYFDVFSLKVIHLTAIALPSSWHYSIQWAKAPFPSSFHPFSLENTASALCSFNFKNHHSRPKIHHSAARILIIAGPVVIRELCTKASSFWTPPFSTSTNWTLQTTIHQKIRGTKVKGQHPGWLGSSAGRCHNKKSFICVSATMLD